MRSMTLTTHQRKVSTPLNGGQTEGKREVRTGGAGYVREGWHLATDVGICYVKNKKMMRLPCNTHTRYP